MGHSREAAAQQPSNISGDHEPKLVISDKSQRVIVGNFLFSMEIHRLETDKIWTLEVVDHESASHVWDDRFQSNKEAHTAAVEVLEREGAPAFMHGDPFVPLASIVSGKMGLRSEHR
jgi:hypothetical protein